MKHELTTSAQRQHEALLYVEKQRRERQQHLQLVDAAYRESRLTFRCVYCGSEGHSTDSCVGNDEAA